MSAKVPKRLPYLSYNPLSALGAAIALITGITLGALLSMSFASHQDHPYFGIFMYMVLPPVLIFGLLLIPLGMYLRWRKFKKTGELPEAKWPRIDLNDSRHRNAFFIFAIGTVIVATLMAVGSYGAYHYSESVEFCGTTCHTVMEPEYVTYQNSPHARVACASCHVGPGADWYVKSKLSGVYQIYAAAAGVYPRPIDTPIENLRPAQQTCEQCHWPSKIYGAEQRLLHHYKYDDANTHWPIDLLIKTGGGDPRSGQSGIHWHMNIGVEVQYVARDEDRQDIPWMRVLDRTTGRVTVYQNTENPLSAEELAAAPKRIMDCMDCHNRPSHAFRSPDRVIDEALHRRTIDPTLPGIKFAAVAAMAEEYPTKEEAMRQISTRITEHFESAHPQVLAQRAGAVRQAIEATQEAYATNVFPHMKARWDVYPSNLGHFTSPGCMRCHDGKHAAPDGRVVTTDCNACHLILAQGAERETLTLAGLPFEHPEDIGGMELEMPCYECHTGVQP